MVDRRHDIWTLSEFGIMMTNVGPPSLRHVHVAAIALELNAPVHSNDTDFGRFPGLRRTNPLVAG